MIRRTLCRAIRAWWTTCLKSCAKSRCYSYREIAEPLHLSPQAASVMLARHRRSLKSLRGVMELCALSPRAVNVLGRHGIRTREQARHANVLERLAGERNCGRKTIDEIARWVE